MAKGYLLVSITVTDPDAYARYVQVSAEVLKAFGGRLLVKAETAIIKEGAGRTRNVIFEFESFEKVKAYWDSPEYQAAKLLRIGAADGEFILIEGVD